MSLRYSRAADNPSDGATAGDSLIQHPRSGIEQEAEQADNQHCRRQFGIGETIARIEDEISKPGGYAEHLAGHQNDPDDADRQPQPGENVTEHAGDNDMATEFPSASRTGWRQGGASSAQDFSRPRRCSAGSAIQLRRSAGNRSAGHRLRTPSPRSASTTTARSCAGTGMPERSQRSGGCSCPRQGQAARRSEAPVPVRPATRRRLTRIWTADQTA